MNSEDFKSHLLNTMKPKKFKHFSYGQKSENMLLTRIRVNCSYLKVHSYKTGHSLTTECFFCPNKSKSSIHFLIQCPGFSNFRNILFDQIQKNFIPNFSKLSMKRQYEILVFGYEPYNHEMKQINGKMMMFTQAFIRRQNVSKLNYNTIFWCSCLVLQPPRHCQACPDKVLGIPVAPFHFF